MVPARPLALLPALAVLGLALPAAAQPTKPAPKKPTIRAAFDDALAAFNEDPQRSIPKLEALVTTRWSELSAKGKHASATLLMFAHLAAKQPAKAHTVGVALNRRLPAAFLALGRLTRDKGLSGQAVRDALDVLALRTERGRSVVYLHNASRRDLRLDLGKRARYALTYSYQTRAGKVAAHSAQDPRALPGGIVVLPRGGGAFLHSPAANAKLPANVPDLVTVLAAEAKRRLRGWIHLGEGDYEQRLERWTFVARARWGGERWSEVTLVELSRGKKKPKRPKPTPTATGPNKHPRYAKVGQRWTFLLPGGVTVVKEVLALEKGGVKVRSTALLDGKPLRAPSTQLWQPPATPPDPKAITQQVVVSGRAFACQVVREDGARVWRVPVFPGVIKAVQKGRTTLELIDISVR